MTLAKIINLKQMKEYFYYDATSTTGLRWNKIQRNNTKSKLHDEAGQLHKSNGYYNVQLNGKKYLVHRIIYSIVNNIELSSDIVIDHIDRNMTNNLENNLRAVTQRKNSNNKIKRGTSKYFGVYYSKTTKKWRAACRGLDGKKIFLKEHLLEIDAAKAYDTKIKELGLDKLGSLLNF